MQSRRAAAISLAACFVLVGIMAIPRFSQMIHFANANRYKSASTTAFAKKLHGLYDDIELEYRPEVRWWLAEGMNTDKTLEKNLQQIYDYGFGAVEFLAMPEPGVDSAIYGWGSEEWLSDSQLIVNKAAELGLGFSLTSGAHWANANLPDTFVWDGEIFSPDNKAASKELDYATILLHEGESFDGELPLSPMIKAAEGDTTGAAADYQQHVFQGAVAAKLVKERPESGQEYGYAEGGEPGVVDMASLLDLSDQVVEKDGEYSLNWTPPEGGEYVLFVYWMHGTSQTASPSVSTNYTINYMDSYGVEALIDYWNQNILTENLRETLEKSGRGEIYMDSLEVNTYGAGGLFWGYHFKQEFIDRMGYDITPYLPVVVTDSGRVQSGLAKVYDYEPSDDADLTTAEKVRVDYYKVMTDMYMENVLEPLQTWLHSMNMELRAEPSYGFNFEISTPGAYIDGIETESYAQNADVDLYRGLLGSANMYGRLFSSETGAVPGRNYYYGMEDWTNLCCLQFVNGVNRTVFHGYSGIEGSEQSTYWPGHEGMYARFSERFNERQPASEMYPAWTEMLGRNQKMLRQGNPSRDIAILRTDYSFINYGFPQEHSNFAVNYQMYDTPYFWSDLELQQNGYTYDYFSPLLLLDGENVSWTSDALQPDGPNYQAVIVYQEAIELEAAQKLLEIAQSGLPIVFADNNTEITAHDGTVNAHKEAASRSRHLNVSDEEIRAVVSEIKQLENVVTVDSPADAMEALQKMGVYPRAAFTEPNNKVLTISREDEENGIWYTFVYAYKFEVEKDSAPCTVTLSFDVTGKPYEMNDWSGDIMEIGAYEIVDGRTNVTRTLAPGESAWIIIDENDIEGANAVHAISTTADRVVLGEDGVSILAMASGEYETVLSNGETVSSSIEVPEAIQLPAWDIVIEDWNEGDKVVNTEEKFGHTTTEVYYTTKKTEIVFQQSRLTAWKDLPETAAQLNVLDGGGMSYVSGIAAYTARFEVPDEWSNISGAFLTIGSVGGGAVEVYVNGQKASGLDWRTLSTDISDLLKTGENKIRVRVASTLTNRLLQRNYQNNGSNWTDNFPMIQDYGMVGEVAVIPFVVSEVY